MWFRGSVGTLCRYVSFTIYRQVNLQWMHPVVLILYVSLLKYKMSKKPKYVAVLLNLKLLTLKQCCSQVFRE
jgi:hypothetical protein